MEETESEIPRALCTDASGHSFIQLREPRMTRNIHVLCTKCGTAKESRLPGPLLCIPEPRLFEIISHFLP